MYKHSNHGPVVHLDRSQKGLMVKAILEDAIGDTVAGKSVLDIGCGNGGIAAAFAEDNDVWGVDIEDKRRDGFPINFSVVESERLPHDDDSFDVVISHHVIEHVQDQRMHLAEMRRVLRPEGRAYIATPNKTSPIMSGHVGNEMVLHWPAMRPLFESAGFQVTEYGWKVFTQPNKFYGSPSFGKFFPPRAARALQRWFPSHMFVLVDNAQRERTRG